jgi:hypothetical protein
MHLLDSIIYISKDQDQQTFIISLVETVCHSCAPLVVDAFQPESPTLYQLSYPARHELNMNIVSVFVYTKAKFLLSLPSIRRNDSIFLRNDHLQKSSLAALNEKRNYENESI